ncbi:hypothetical protein B0H13DRAFT_1868234 [Mycena leptocephala]|nr:hypothetical protein B0H13DRAFT_1868234 [Mycena leptocephala]
MPASGKKRKVRKRIARDSCKNRRLWADGVRESILTPHIESYGDALERGWRAEHEALQAICNEFHAKTRSEYDPLGLQPEETLTEEEEVAKRNRIDLLNAAPLKARQAYQQFMHERYHEDIAPIVSEAEVAQDLFNKLPEEERAGYAARAKEEAMHTHERYEDDMKKATSRHPRIAKCIDGVGSFLGPILQGIHERTGLHATVVLGGPIPSYGGELKTIYASYGHTKSGIAHFPDWAKGRWNIVLDLMKEYLQVAFSKQDQVEAALPENMLAGAKYIIGPDGGVSTTDSETNTETDSNADSDDTNAPAQEKRKKDHSARKNGKKSTKTAKADKKAARMSIKGDGGGEGKGTKKKASKGKGKAGDEAEGSPRKRKRLEVEREDDGAKSPKKSKKRDVCDAEKQGTTTPRKWKRAGEGMTKDMSPTMMPSASLRRLENLNGSQ